MRILASVLMIAGGGLLLIPKPGGDTDVAVVKTVLTQAYEADRASKVATLRQLAAMSGSSTEERAKAWEEMDRAEFSKNFDEMGNVVSKAIREGKELDLAKAWEKP